MIFRSRCRYSFENRRDDFGILGERLENMKCQIRDLIREVKNESYVIGEVVDTVKTNVITLNGNIEDVSATTEELAASMEETAASSDTIKSMSLEIEEAAKNIANRSQDGHSRQQIYTSGHQRHRTIPENSVSMRAGSTMRYGRALQRHLRLQR